MTYPAIDETSGHRLVDLAPSPAPAQRLRALLAEARAAGIDFATAWYPALDAVAPAGSWRAIFESHAAHWNYAYDGERDHRPVGLVPSLMDDVGPREQLSDISRAELVA